MGQETCLGQLKKWKNLLYILLAIGILIMICLAASSTQDFLLNDDDEESLERKSSNWWRTDGLLLNHTPGVLFGCPSLEAGRLWTFETKNNNDPSNRQSIKIIEEFLEELNITGLIFTTADQVRAYVDQVIRLKNSGNLFGILIDFKDHNEYNFSGLIRQASNAFSEATNGTVKPKFIRFLGGDFKNMTKEANSLGYTVVLWNSVIDFTVIHKSIINQMIKYGPQYGGILRVERLTTMPPDILEQLKEKLEEGRHKSEMKALDPGACFRVSRE